MRGRVISEHNGVPYHDGEGSTSLSDNLVSLVGQIGNANGRRALGGSRGHLGRDVAY